jgi:carboxylate-amine ligase
MASHPFQRQGSIGIEEEFYAVDPDSLEPADAADELLADPPEPLEGNLGVELMTCVIETRTPVAEDLEEAGRFIRRQRQALKAHASDHGYGLLAAGLHPTADWRQLRHPAKERYQDQLRRIQYPQRRNLTAGLHVHIGLDDPERAVYVVDELRQYIPLFLALSANSPFWQAESTGLASTRALVFTNLPNTGIPTSFGSWEGFRDLESTMLETDSIADRGGLWWDVRPHTGYGTVEVRAMDGQRDPERTEAFLALVKALIEHLEERYRADEPRTQVRQEYLEQNRWRALRHGQEASFIRDGRTVDLETWFGELLDTLKAERRSLIETLTASSPAQDQIDTFNEDGMAAVLESLEL